ncbi:MAG TPA: substrate-binding domain-containing protein, partial [Spirochaetia bacterium]|nr:substrate-binding domain-containing protein [Spirochaetia bacterium]
QTNNIGMIFPPEEYILARPYFTELAVKLEQNLSSRGYHLFLGSIKKESGDPELHRLIAERKVDGLIIFAPSEDDPNVRLLVEEKVAFVAVHGRSRSAEYSYVDTDNAAGMSLILEYLTGLGHRKIAFVCGRLEEINAQERLATYRKFLMSRAIDYDERLVYRGDWSLESGHDAFHALYDRPERPTAIVFSNDQMALGGIKAAHDRKVAVPQEVSITGYDDIEYASFSSPSLTTIRQPTSEIARIAVDLVLERIPKKAPCKRIVLDPQLIVRSSTAMLTNGIKY